jgi:hypothetical protein
MPAGFSATLSGPFGTAVVNGVDATREGAGVVSAVPLTLNSLVFLRITTLGVGGFAYVRHCSPLGGRYRIGLQYRDRLSVERPESKQWIRQHVSQSGRELWDQAEL